MGDRRPRLRTLIVELVHRHPRLGDPGALIAGGEILVNGFPRMNPQVLLTAGAARVYAIDAGHGQLRGELQQDPRVINLKRTNLGQLTTELVPEPVDVVTIDLSYLSLAAAAPQLVVLQFAPLADLISLVKPVYELGLATLPEDDRVIAAAVWHTADGLETAGWVVRAAKRSPVRGARGATEWLLHAQQRR